MSGRLLLSILPGELRAARLNAAGRLEDYLVQRADGGAAVGDVWAARVGRLQKGLGAFLDLGDSRPALLDWADCPRAATEGAVLVVRIARLPRAGKGAKVKPAEPPRPIPRDAALPLRLARGDDPLDLLGRDLAEVLCDNGGWLPELRRRLPETVAVRLAGPRPPLFDPELEAELAGLLAREVSLPGGGRLLVEPVETLTAIDVDSGGGPAAGQGALETNLEAAGEIARQVRLRALSGLIVVDFLELRGRGQRERLHTALKRAFADDPVETSVFPPLPSGLVEIARQRRRPPLHELLCRQAGWQPSAETRAYEALRLALAQPPAARLGLALSPDAAAALDGPLAEARHAVEARLGTPLRLLARPQAPGQPPEILTGAMLE